MEQCMNKVVGCVTQDGRFIVGTLKGYDQTTNVVLSDSHERVFSTSIGVETVPLGLYIVRGDNIVLIGELDAELDASVDLADVRAAPLKPVVY